MSDPTFSLLGSNIFGLTGAGSYVSPELRDLDGDGDLDALVGNGDGELVYFRNDGSSTSPTFVLAGTNPFGLDNTDTSAAPVLADIDGDGDLDVLVGTLSGGVVLYENIGTSSSPSFSLIGSEPFGLSNVGLFAEPVLKDIDGDGDLDALIINDTGGTLFFRNNGDSSSPTFSLEGTDLFGLETGGALIYGSLELADLDGDGDLDALGSSMTGLTLAYRNNGTSSSPTFSLEGSDPFGLQSSGNFAALALADLDGDGDLDLVIGDGAGSFTIYRNGPPSSLAAPQDLALDDASNSGSTADLLTSDDTPTITGTAAAGGVVTLYDDGVAVGTALADGVTGAWSITTGGSLTDGVHDLTATVALAGDTSAASTALSITIDTVAPNGGFTLSKAGSQERANSVTSNGQDAAAVAMDADGNFVVTWASNGQDGAAKGVYGQRYTAAGSAVGNEFRVNSHTSGHQSNSSVAMDADGDFVVTWSSYGQDGSNYGVYGQRYTAAGSTVGGEFRVSSYTSGSQGSSSVAMNADGDYIVTWTSEGQDGSQTGVYGQRYDAAGSAVGGEFRVNSYTSGSQTSSSVAMDADGGFIVTWHSNGQDGSDRGVYAQRYSPAGSALGSEFRVNSYTFSNQMTPSVAVDQSGGFVIAWQSDGQDGNGYGVYGQRYNAAGSALGSEFRVNTVTSRAQENVAIAMGDDGNFLITWTSDRQDGSDDGIFGKLYDRFGSAVGSEFQVNTTTGDDQQYSSVAMDGNGNVVVAFESPDGSDDGVFFQRFTRTPAPLPAPDLIAASDTGRSSSDNITKATNPTVTGTTEAYATVRLYGTDGTTLLDSATAGSDGAWTMTASSLSEGAHTLTIRAVDLADNTSAASSALALTIDLTAPVAPVGLALDENSDSGVAGDRLTNSYQPMIRGTAEANSTVTLYDTDGSAVLGTAIADGSGQWNIYSGSLIDGAHSLTVKAVDAAGNTSVASAPLVLTIDTTPPELSMDPLGSDSDTGAGDGRYTSDDTPTVTGTAEVGSTVTLYDGSMEIGTVLVGGDGLWTFTTGVLSEGDHTLAALATDEAGNSDRTPDLVVTVDKTAPALGSLRIGGETRVDGDGSSIATNPAVGINEDGGFVLVWDEDVEGSGNHEILGRRYDQNGSAIGSEFVVGSAGDQTLSTVAMNGEGRFVVTWTSDTVDGVDRGVAARVYDANGAPVAGEFQVNSEITYDQSDSAVAMNADGDFVVTWQSDDQDGDDWGIYAQRYDRNGSAVGGEFRVNSTTSGDQMDSAVAMNADGDFVVTWTSYGQDGYEEGIYAQRYDHNGSAVGSEFQVNSYTDADQVNSAVAMNADGAFIVTWWSRNESSNGIYAQRYDRYGSAIGGEFKVSIADIRKEIPSIAVDADGDFVVTWSSPDEDGPGVYARRFSSTGTAVSGEFLINSTTSNTQFMPSVAMNGDGDFVVAWASEDDASTGVDFQLYGHEVSGALGLAASSDTGSSDSDGITSDTTPDILGVTEAGATVVLYDTDGSTALGTAVADGNGAWTITPSLSGGGCSLTVRAVDLAGNTSAPSAALAITIDATLPGAPSLDLTASSDTGLSDSDDITGDDTPDIAGTAEAGSTVVLYEGAVALGTAVADGGGHWTITSGTLIDGVRSLTAQAIDPAGNTSASSATLTLTIDTAAPPAPGLLDLHDWSDTGSSDSDDITGDDTPSITGTATAGSTVTLYDGATAVGTAVADGGGLWTVTSAGLGEGQHTLTARTIGPVNNSALSDPLEITIDLTVGAPGGLDLHVWSDTGVSDSDDLTGDSTPDITGTAEAGSTITLYDGTGAVGTAQADGWGHWTITTSGLNDGRHTLTARAVDEFGHTSVSSAGLEITIDTVAPGVPSLDLTAASDTGRSSSDDVTSDTTPDITGTAEAGALVVLYDGVAATGTAVADGSGRWTITSTTLGEGLHTLTAQATDAAGNSSAASGNLVLTIDTTAPTVTPGILLTPASDSGTAGDGITTDRTPDIAGTAEAGSTITLYDGASVVGTVQADGWGHWTITSSQLGYGAHTLHATSKDAAGNGPISSSDLNITISAPVSPPPPPPTSTETVDGVTVGKGTKTNSDGSTSTVVTIPVVTDTRNEQVGGNTVADIPLVKTSGGASLLTAQVPTGLGLTMTGSSTVKTAGSSLTDLIREIQAHTETGSSDQTVLTGGGSGFLGGIPSDTPLLVQTIVPTAAPGATASAEPLVITGTPTAAGNPYTALVIDTRGLPSGTTISLQNVEFAAVIGAVRVIGGEGSQNVWGDGEAQYIVLGADDDTLHGGGGDDHVGSRTGNDILYGDGGADTVTGGEDDDLVYGNRQDDMVYGNTGNDTLYGGQDQDAVFGGQGDDVAYGNLGNDVVYGNKGADTLFGGQANDTLFGGQGDDVLFGKLGDDVLTGGAGADLFAFNGGSGNDLIADFRFEEGDRLFADGRSWTVSDGTAGAIVDFGSGDTVTLANIRANQVTGTWFATS